jgi:hypothetical protein
MPAGTSLSLLLPLIAAMSLPTVAIAAVKGPATDDIYAVIGAVIASILAVMDAMQKKRDHFQVASNFLGSAVIGAFAPGILFHTFSYMKIIEPNAQVWMLWQTWAFCGFLMGMNGWFIINRLNDRLRDFIDRFKK